MEMTQYSIVLHHWCSLVHPFCTSQNWDTCTPRWAVSSGQVLHVRGSNTEISMFLLWPQQSRKPGCGQLLMKINCSDQLIKSLSASPVKASDLAPEQVALSSVFFIAVLIETVGVRMHLSPEKNTKMTVNTTTSTTTKLFNYKNRLVKEKAFYKTCVSV